MSYDQAVEYLYSLRLFGAKLGLENTRALARLARNPQERLRFIHVAGTNGKGSTCAFLESIYRTAGARVGLFTSPHLVSFAERIQINRQPIPREEVAARVKRLQELMRKFPNDSHPTFFEVVTVLALGYFADRSVDLVVWETGMGGRLDATNIVTPLASVITNVALDHQSWLGETIDQIAGEKAGIIKKGVPILTAENDPKPLAVIRRTAANYSAPLSVVDARSVQLPSEPGLAGAHQRHNAALAVETARTLGEMASLLSVPESLQTVLRNAAVEKNIARALTEAHWPGRFQILQPSPSRTVVLDGAHNPAGVRSLAETWRERFHDQQAVIVAGFLKDKDWKEMLRVLSPLASRWILVPVASERTAAPEDLQSFLKTLHPETNAESAETLNQALKLAASEPLVLITGSLYLVGEALEFFGEADAGPSERGLNEWGGLSDTPPSRAPFN